ncbi:MAG TPA: HPr family phosphocarrier protein [Gaiellales bacterium]|nr:HPr family phosphocarrier protein [Gaiellales bacterium]
MSQSSELRRTVTLPAGVPLHARPAGALVRSAAALDATVVLNANGRTANASSILQVLALGAEAGADVEVVTSGPGASAALDAIAGLLETLE